MRENTHALASAGLSRYTPQQNPRELLKRTSASTVARGEERKRSPSRRSYLTRHEFVSFVSFRWAVRGGDYLYPLCPPRSPRNHRARERRLFTFLFTRAFSSARSVNDLASCFFIQSVNWFEKMPIFFLRFFSTFRRGERETTNSNSSFVYQLVTRNSNPNDDILEIRLNWRYKFVWWTCFKIISIFQWSVRVTRG